MTAGAITRYRVMAYVTGVLLLVLVLVAMPLKYFAHMPELDKLVGVGHGAVAYPLYVLASLDLALRARWSPLRTILIMVAGTVPFAAIYLERNVVRGAKTALADAQAKEAKAAAKAAKKISAQTPAPEPVQAD